MKLSLKSAGISQGTPIVFLHAFPMSSDMWQPQFEALKNYRLLAPNFRGFGSTPLASPWFIETAVDDVLETVSEQSVYVGLSMGGYVALRLAQKAPQRVKALVLCDTRAEADTNEQKNKRASSVEFVREQGVAAFVDPFLKDALAPETWSRHSALTETIRAIANQASAQAVMSALASLAARGDMTEALSQIQVPTLVMVGAEDKITPLPLAQSIQRAIVGSHLSVIANAGHFSNLENPAEFNRELLSFLKNVKVI